MTLWRSSATHRAGHAAAVPWRWRRPPARAQGRRRRSHVAADRELGELLERDVDEPAGIVLSSYSVESWARTVSRRGSEGHRARRRTLDHPRRLAAQCRDAGRAPRAADLPYVLSLKERILSANPEDVPGWSNHLTENSPSLNQRDHRCRCSSRRARSAPCWCARMSRSRTSTAQCKAGARIELDMYTGIGHFGHPARRTTAHPGLVRGAVRE